MANYRAVNSLSAVDAAYVAGLVDGEGTITLSRKHARDKRQLVVSISSTEPSILDFVHQCIGAGKITTKKRTQPHHSPGFTYAIWNRQALNLLTQIQPFLRSYKQHPSAARVERLRAAHTPLTENTVPRRSQPGPTSKQRCWRCEQTTAP